jgi:hypothetical protein
MTQSNKPRQTPVVEIDLIPRWNLPRLICYNKGNGSPVGQAQP